MTRLAALPDRGVIELAGEDRVAFLQGLVSNDVAAATPGHAVWAALLTPQGKWLADFFTFADGDRLLLDCEAAQAAMVQQRLSRYRLRSKVTLRAVDDLHVFAAWDGEPADWAIAAPDPRLPEAGWRILSASALPTTALAADWDRHRLALGLPDGSRDLEAEKTVLLEAGFDELHGVSWSKGCYMGQELTARTRYRGLVKRRLLPVEVTGPLPPPGTPVLRADAEVGTMRSGREQAGLAVLRLDALDGDLRSGDASLVPRVPRWMQLGLTAPSAPPLRIVNAMLGRGLGGLEQALLDYQDALAGLGHEVHAVIHPDAAIRPALETRGALWHGLPQRGAWDMLAVVRLRRWLQRLRPDISIAHGNRAMSLLRSAGAHPLVAVLPNYKMKCDRADAVFHPTLDLRHHALLHGVPAHRLHHVPSMVAVPLLPPVSDWHNPPVIGAMGRFVAKKGFATFIAALAQLQADGVAFAAVLAGDGPERAALRQQAERSGLGSALAWPGWIDDKTRFFAGIDVFCLPSLHEPFGIVLLEAMAQAKPIVAADSEGPSEILIDGQSGVVVPRGDADRLADALRTLLSDPVRAVGLGLSAHSRALENFTIGHVAARIDAVLRQVATDGLRDSATTTR